MKAHSLGVTLLAALGCARCQSVPQSPCPGVFKYEQPGSDPGKWYGLVTLTTDTILHGVWLNVLLDGKADILGNWIGEVTTSDNLDFKIENTTLKLYPDQPLAVRFFIQYNQYGKAPRISTIRLNGREICSNMIRPVYEFTVRPEDIRPTRDEATTIKVIELRPVNDEIMKITTQSHLRPAYEAINGGNVNPYSIVSGSGTQELGGSEKKRPSAGTQTRPIDRTESRPSYDQNAYDQTRPSSDSRPTYDTDSDISRPSYETRPEKRRTTKKPPAQSTDFQDYSEDTVSPSENDYFSGGLPSIHTVLSSNSATSSNHNSDGECGRPVRGATPLIVNGRQTMEGQWPWQIALYQTQTVDSKYICGGTLISRSHVVTAAHCVTLKSSSQAANKNTFTIYLGKYNLRTSVEGVQIRFISKIHVHPSFNASSFSRDAAVLKLRESTDFTDHVRPVCLWPDDQVDLSYIVGKRGTVVGWGFDEKGLATEELHMVEMPVVDQETCIRSYSEFFARFTSQYTYCAGFRDGRSVCNGDSGGGMVFRIGDTWHLRGLVSLSSARQNDARCDTSHYVIFTDLAKSLSWLRQIVDEY